MSNRVYNEKGRENLDEALSALNLVDDDKDVLADNLDKTTSRWHMNYTNDISPAYSFALKKYPFNGKNYNIVTIVIRGTNEDKDKAKDFEDKGFISAAQSVYEELDNFLDGRGIKISDKNNRFLITGHSLGGAVANLLQYYIIKNNYEEFMSSDDEEEPPLNNGMTCYTYESPCTLWASDRTYSQSGRSINFIKEGDLIPFLSNDLSMYIRNAATYAYANSAVGIINRGLLLYKPKYYSSMRYGIDIYMGGITDRSKELFKEYVGRDYDAFNGDISKDVFDRYHQCEIDMALIKDRVERGVIQQANSLINQNQRIISTYCPVDIEIINKSSGDTVAAIVNSEVSSKSDDNIHMITIGDEKFLSIPTDTDYSVRLTGTDEGTMDFVIQDLCQDDDGLYLSNTSRFDGVALAKGKVMESPVTTTVSTSEIKLFVLDENGKAVKSVSEDGTEIDYKAGG